ncbi:MAG: peroxidase [Bryobacterales bacterium]|nr:peroxidase [Bryobacterales bacterium]
MYLPGIEANPNPGGDYGDAIRMARSGGLPLPQILHLFSYKPEATKHLAQYTQSVMRGPSPLSPGFRELIAAVTSAGNHCLF